ncbi:glycosyltransferase family protein [Shimazuella alba]|uniref:Helix-turn-helix domain-containing protein n=1 Tax=Shimazuella alba TaxID=2690964 RepID=A0A6I4VZC7_9BACL|nr:glycosyltransferase family protein [Shimazuella alba]MXQ55285.1 helix-turn-helix domain-containing protein [Shimazuella alba]
MDKKRVGVKLKAERTKRGILQKEIADQLKVGTTTISNLERGFEGVAEEKYILYAQEFGLAEELCGVISEEELRERHYIKKLTNIDHLLATNTEKWDQELEVLNKEVDFESETKLAPFYHFLKGKIYREKGKKINNQGTSNHSSNKTLTKAEDYFLHAIDQINEDPFQNIGNFTCVEEKKRLRLFFPKYDYRFITSFYKLPNIEDNDTEIIPTIIRSDIKKAPRYTKHPQIHLVVYLSEYGGTSIKQTSNEWKEELASIPNVFFTIFDVAVETPRKNGNLEIRPFDRTDFAETLKVADGVITTAGHTLLSECLYLGLPIYVIPLGTFDQHYCANFIQDNQLGISSYSITKKECLDFIALLDHWKNNIKNCDNILTSSDSVQTIVDFLEDLYEKTGDKCR